MAVSAQLENALREYIAARRSEADKRRLADQALRLAEEAHAAVKAKAEAVAKLASLSDKFVERFVAIRDDGGSPVGFHLAWARGEVQVRQLDLEVPAK